MYRLLANLLILALVLVNATARPTSFQNRAVHSVDSGGEESKGNYFSEVRPREISGLVYRSSMSQGLNHELAANGYEASAVNTANLLPQIKVLWDLLHPLFFPVNLYYLKDLISAFHSFAPSKYPSAISETNDLEMAYIVLIQALRGLGVQGVHNHEISPEKYHPSQAKQIAEEVCWADDGDLRTDPDGRRNLIYISLMTNHAHQVVTGALGQPQYKRQVSAVVIAALSVFGRLETLCNHIFPNEKEYMTKDGKKIVHQELEKSYATILGSH